MIESLILQCIGLHGLLGVALALGFKFHLRFPNRHFLKLGSLSRHAAARAK